MCKTCILWFLEWVIPQQPWKKFFVCSNKNLDYWDVDTKWIVINIYSKRSENASKMDYTPNLASSDSWPFNKYFKSWMKERIFDMFEEMPTKSMKMMKDLLKKDYWEILKNIQKPMKKCIFTDKHYVERDRFRMIIMKENLNCKKNYLLYG